MGCGCVYTGIDEDSCYTTLKDKILIAKKTYECVECQCLIKVGDKFNFFQGTHSDSTGISTYHTCLDCLSIINEFFCDGWCYGACLESLEEHIEDMDGNILSECIVSLTKKAKDRVCDMIEKCWDGSKEDE